jgi:hypothetical protein
MASIQDILEQCSEAYTVSESKYRQCLFNRLNTAIAGPLAELKQVPGKLLTEAGKVVKATGKTVEAQAVSELIKTQSVARDFVASTDKIIFDNLSDIGDTIKDVNASVYTQAAETAQRVDETFGLVDDYVRERSIQTAQEIGNVSQSVIGDISNLSESASLDSNNIATSVIQDVDGLTKAVQNQIRTDIDTTTASLEQAAQSYITANKQVIADFTEVTGQSVTEVGSLTKTIDEGVIPEMRDTGAALRNAWFMRTAKANADEIKAMEESMLDPEIVLARMVTGDITFDDVFNDKGTNTTFWGSVLASGQRGASNILMAMNAAMIANSTRIEKMLQELWTNDPVRSFGFETAVSLAARGHLNLEDGELEGLKAGYDRDRFEIAWRSAQTPLSIEQAFVALNRKEIDEDEFKATLTRLGYNTDDAKTLRALAYVRPGLQDIITMALRDVFNPAAVDRFELFKELPDRFIEEAGKSGLTEEWAKFYWGAHWTLPSLNQGFEMFHRRLIDKDTINLLIATHDVSPFWRDKLIGIAYNNYTRVDIRRMYKLGVMTKDEVYEAHLDLGYDETKADKMTEFVIQLIDDSELDDDVDPRDLTKTQIKNLFLQGTLSKDDTVERMIELGYSSDAAILLVGSWETDQQIKDRERVINLIISKAVRERLSNTEVESLFAGLDLTVGERETALKEIALRMRETPSIPSKSELKAMVSSGIIDFQTWYNTMQQHGYADVWIDRYVELWGITNG